MNIKDKKGSVWECIPVRSASEYGILPQNIMGDVMRKGSSPIGTLTRTDEEGNTKSLTIYPFKEKLSFFEKVTGYIPYGEGEDNREYVRIVRRSVPKTLLPLILLLAVITGGIAFYMLRDRGPDLDDSAVAYTLPGGTANTDPTRLMMPYMTEITVTDGESANVLVNPDGNQSYFRYVLMLNDSEETVYQSGLIEPGTAITDWELDTELEPGDYEATMRIETFSLEDHEESTNGGNMEVILHVE